jgi:UDP-glucose 4-epimerase
MRVLVTGGAGFIGSHVVDALVRDGHEVLIVDNLRTGRRENLESALKSDAARLLEMDVLDASSFEQAAREFGPGSIVHLAALVSVQEARRSPNENFRLNLEATQRVIAAATSAKATRIVFASSAAVYGDNPRMPLVETERSTPLGLYGGAKAASELLLATAAADLGFEAVSLRFFNVFGPRQRADSPYSGVISIFVDRISRGLPVTIFGDGLQTRDFIGVQDVAAAVGLAATLKDGLSGVFNVCTGRRTSLLDVISAAEEQVARKVPVEFAAPRPVDIKHSFGDPSAYAAATGFAAKGSLGNALQSLLGVVVERQTPS